jgi:hypothetical protein
MAKFLKIKDLIRGLKIGDQLISDMFDKRKTVAIKYDDALETLDGDENQLKFLIAYEVIEQNGDSLELNDTYLQFFENVLQVNEDINVAFIAQYVDKLKSNINYYLASDNEKRKQGYMKEIRHTFLHVEQTTRHNVVDLKRNIDNTYKQEPDFKIKRLRLKVFDEKSHHVMKLIHQTEKMIDEQTIFFKSASDVGLHQTIAITRRGLIDSAHGIIDIQHQIVDYLNKIEYQSRIVKKVRKLKYLKDQFMLNEHTNVNEVMANENALWIEKQPRYVTRVSLDFLRNDDSALPILEAVRRRLSKKTMIKSKLSGQIDERYLQEQKAEQRVFNHQELINGFLAQSNDLFAYLWNYPFHAETSREERLVLFLQLASQYDRKIRFMSEIRQFENLEYPVILPQ